MSRNAYTTAPRAMNSHQGMAIVNIFRLSRVSGRGTYFCLLFAVFAVTGAAQQPEFDVATLKPWTPPEGDRININLGTALHGKVTLTNATLSDCIKFAYSLSSDAQLSGPDWIRAGPERFDIVAQAPPDTPRERLFLMLQKLLADRLNLRMHREERQLSFVALVVAKGGAKLHEVDPETPTPFSPSSPGHIQSPRMSMTTLAKLLARFQRETVLDMTGLSGFYEVHLEYAPESIRPILGGGDAAGRVRELDSPDGPSIYTALQKQLGLKLEGRKGPVDVLVVDSADRVPAAN